MTDASGPMLKLVNHRRFVWVVESLGDVLLRS